MCPQKGKLRLINIHQINTHPTWDAHKHSDL